MPSEFAHVDSRQISMLQSLSKHVTHISCLLMFLKLEARQHCFGDKIVLEWRASKHSAPMGKRLEIVCEIRCV